MKELHVLEGHRGWITALDFNKDGLLASGSTDGLVKLWDINSGKLIVNLVDDYFGPVNTLSFHSDGKLLAVAGYTRKINLWDISNNDGPIKVFKCTSPVSALTFSPNGESLAVGYFGKNINIFSIMKKSVKKYSVAGTHISCLLYCHSGSSIICATLSGDLTNIDLISGKIKALKLPAKIKYVKSISDDEILVIGLGTSNEEIFIWRIFDDTIHETIRFFIGASRSILCDFKQNILITGGELTGDIRVWDIPSKTELIRTMGHDLLIEALAINIANTVGFLASGSDDQKIKIWGVDFNLKTE